MFRNDFSYIPESRELGYGLQMQRGAILRSLVFAPRTKPHISNYTRLTSVNNTNATRWGDLIAINDDIHIVDNILNVGSPALHVIPSEFYLSSVKEGIYFLPKTFLNDVNAMPFFRRDSLFDITTRDKTAYWLAGYKPFHDNLLIDTSSEVNENVYLFRFTELNTISGVRLTESDEGTLANNGIDGVIDLYEQSVSWRNDIGDIV